MSYHILKEAEPIPWMRFALYLVAIFCMAVSDPDGVDATSFLEDLGAYFIFYCMTKPVELGNWKWRPRWLRRKMGETGADDT